MTRSSCVRKFFGCDFLFVSFSVWSFCLVQLSAKRGENLILLVS